MEQIEEFLYSGKPFEGIFNKIKSEKGIDELKKLVKIIPSDTICSNFSNIIDCKFRQHWFSFFPNPWIMFDFGEKRIKISDYSLKTYSGDPGCGHMKSWKMEGSNDANKFEKIDEVIDSDLLNSPSAEQTFNCNCEKFYKYIKLSLIGMNHAGSDFLVIRSIEFFGSLLSSNSEIHSC